jgi:DNA transformation protein
VTTAVAVSPDYLDYLRDQLEAFGPFDVRRMFGGAGLFRDGMMFALVVDDALYLKVDDRNRPDFEAAGMAPFSYQRKGKTAALKSYYEAPPELSEDADGLSDWARRAFDAALAGAKAKR